MKIIQSALAYVDITELKPMQTDAIDAYKKPNDLILLSPTGSGKTLAFLLPMLTSLNPDDKRVQTLILAPSRELAQQIERVFRSLSTGYKVTCCYGGHQMSLEKQTLTEPPAVLIGTPGRILDHIERHHIETTGIKTLILDEFDKSLEFGFTDEMSAIIGKLRNVKKRILTSATDAEIPDYANMNEPICLNYLTESNIVNGLTLKVVKSEDKDKLDTLNELICTLGDGPKIVFLNQRESVERVSDFLAENSISNSFFHGGMEQADRERALIKFRNGSVNVIVSTDLAARGIDIPDIKHIIHYHLPLNEEAFIHRNGRTARMNGEGTAYMIVGPTEFLPDYIADEPEELLMPSVLPQPVVPEWITLYIGKGKKDKLNKVDIVGFLIQKGGLEKCEIGMIEVKEFYSYVAVKRSRMSQLLKTIHNQKIKNMKTKFAPSM